MKEIQPNGQGAEILGNLNDLTPETLNQRLADIRGNRVDSIMILVTVAAAEALLIPAFLGVWSKSNPDWLALGLTVAGGAGFAYYIRTEMRRFTAERVRIIQTAVERGYSITGRYFKHIRPTPLA